MNNILSKALQVELEYSAVRDHFPDLALRLFLSHGPLPVPSSAFNILVSIFAHELQNIQFKQPSSDHVRLDIETLWSVLTPESSF